MAISNEIRSILHDWEQGSGTESAYHVSAKRLLEAIARADDAVAIVRDLHEFDPNYFLDVDLRMEALKRAVELSPDNMEVLASYKDYLDFVGGPDYPKEKDRVRHLIDALEASPRDA